MTSEAVARRSLASGFGFRMPVSRKRLAQAEQSIRATLSKILGDDFQSVASIEVRSRVSVLFAHCVTQKLMRQSMPRLRRKRSAK